MTNVSETPTDFDWAVRTSIYATFGSEGRAPTFDELAALHDCDEARIETAVQRMYAAHEIAPTPDGKAVWMANPFSAVETDYPVETPEMSCYANCAWDALGVAAILEVDGFTQTKCAGSGAPLEFGVRRCRLYGDRGVIHLVTPLRHAWDDIGFT